MNIKESIEVPLYLQHSRRAYCAQYIIQDKNENALFSSVRLFDPEMSNQPIEWYYHNPRACFRLDSA